MSALTYIKEHHISQKRQGYAAKKNNPKDSGLTNKRSFPDQINQAPYLKLFHFIPVVALSQHMPLLRTKE